MSDRMRGIRSRCFQRRRGVLNQCVVFAHVALMLAFASAQTAPDRQYSRAKLDDILAYIHNGWDALTRSTTSCSGINDPKLSGVPVLYLPANFSEPDAVKRMQRECGV